MVFSYIPGYLDPPNRQQQADQQAVGSANDHSSNHHLQPLAPQPQVGGAALGTAQVRPNSMVERARLANITLPDPALKCPRCDSTNTKFCYFNNYSLSQPRHFCKTCRRYWTRGGALRNVPVGGGFRRNKRTKSNGGNTSRSKSTVLVSAEQQDSTSSSHQSCTNPNKTLNLGHVRGLTSNMPILPPLQSLGDPYNPRNQGLDFGGIQINHPGNNISSGQVDQWRSSLQQVDQFRFLINMTELGQSSNVLYPLMECNEGVNHDHGADYDNQLRPKPLSMDMAVEENDQGVDDLSKNFLGNINISPANDQYAWGTTSSNPWSSDLPRFASNNSTSHLL